MSETFDFKIALGGRRFDPADGIPSDAVASSASQRGGQTEGLGAYVVQFTRPLTRADREALSRYGLSLQDYVPELAYLELLTEATRERLVDDELVRAVVPYVAAFKLDPDIGRREFVSQERREAGDLLMVVGFPNESLAELQAALERLNVSIRSANLEIADGTARFVVGVPGLETAREIAEIPGVRSVEEVGDVTLNNGTTSWVIQSNVANSRPLWDRGLRGEGQIIGHIDGALDLTHCFFQDQVNNTPRPAHRKVVAVHNVNGGTNASDHGTFSAGNAAGEDVNADALSAVPNANNGNAPRARLAHAYLWDLNWIAGGTVTLLDYLGRLAADGACIHTNSWDDKSTSNYTQLSVDADRFTWDNEDHLIVIGPDNGGTIRPPDSSKNALVVNATRQSPNQGDFSSGIMMFSLDGRRKPDLMAPGQNIRSADDTTACGTRVSSGTSFAAPAVAGAAALVRQYYTEGWYPTGTREPTHAFVPTGALLKATLINSTVDAAGIAGYPGAAATGEGWGRLLLNDGLHFANEQRNSVIWDVRNSDGLLTGEVVTHNVDVVSNALPLKVTLAWSEPPALANAAKPVVNNLDLTVVSPDGMQTFRGNVFAGGVSVVGGTADALNNVEVVLVNAPAPGNWTVRVAATTVNVGNPGQGYALVASGDLAKPPVSTGVQDAIVVRVTFDDVAFVPALPNLQNVMADAGAYISAVSYGQATLVPTFRGPVALDHPKNYYYHPDRNLLIELTEEVVAKLVAAEPTLFNAIERLVIVTNDINFNEDWATTGPWPYSMPAGFTRPISVSVHSYANSLARFTHGLLHHFGLLDLYAHDGVTFPRPYVDEWDNMGGIYNNVHPLIWSKQRANWLTAHGDTITFIPRPGAGGSYTGANPIPIFYNTSTAANRKAIAIGLTAGRAQLADEDVFYFIEARDQSATPYDSGLPGSGVLVYFVNELIPQGEGPVILRDRNLVTAALNDAFFRVGDSVTIPGAGITLTVQAGSGGAPFAIQVQYAPPVTDYNVSITRGDTINGQFFHYFSPDIWVDSPKNGFNLGGGPPSHDQREHPVAGVVNRIYARVHNAGPGTAFDFDVRFRISEPHHTVGGEPDFDKFVGIKHIASLPPGQTDVFAPWTPVSGGAVHSCVKVDLINLVGIDTNEHDNWAQENLDVVTSVTASPFQPVTSNFNLTNPYDHDALFYFRVDNAPSDWSVELNPRKIRLAPGTRFVGEVTIAPPEDARVCSNEFVQVTSWTPRGDTLINVGGEIVQIDLRRSTTIDLKTNTERCDGRDWEEIAQERVRQGRKPDIEVIRQRCGRIRAVGCLDPPQAGVEVILRYVDPLGNVTFHTVITDANGCFEDFIASVASGTWQVAAEYPGGECDGPATAGPVTVCWCHD
jgi:hypothetical protein